MLCPSSDATYFVEVRDETRVAMATASVALTTAPCALPDAAIDDATTPNGCDPRPLTLRALTCSFEGVPDAPVLPARQAYTVHLRSNLASESMVQLQAWAGCSAETIETLMLPAGPFELDRCISSVARERGLSLALFSGSDPAIWTPEGLSGELCAGCP